MRFSSSYVCQQCGYISPVSLGRCPNCDNWNSFVETVEQVGKDSGGKKKVVSKISPVKLSLVEFKSTSRVTTGNGEIDLVLGGGVVPGMAVLLAGEPGIGKSTLLLSIADSLSNKLAGEILYICGEESGAQVKIRAQRLGINTSKITVFEQTDVDQIVSEIETNGERYSFIVVDSIQTLTTSDLSGGAGSVGQVRETVGRILAVTKRLSLPVFLVGHVTKEGAIAGPKVVEHAVDTILTVEGEKFTTLRLIRASKNRFGPTDEVGILEMSDTGLRPVANLEEMFVDRKMGGQVGSCLTITMEGTRPLLVEIQALVTDTFLPMPRRVANGVSLNRLQMIIAVLQKKLNLPLYKSDIYVSVSGGINISEPAVDLPVAIALISSFKDKALPSKTVAFGELDLMGNVRGVNSLAKRVKEAKKMGIMAVLSSENLTAVGEVKI